MQERTGVNKTTIVRQKIWSRLRDYALPDTHFHYNFAEVIPDFVDGAQALDRVEALPEVRDARLLFVTPDNCLTDMRRRLLEAGRTLVVSTYGIYRGFFRLGPDNVPKGHERYAAWLEGLEYFGTPVTLAQIADLGRFDAMLTGASAVSLDGVRFGKGHGFFDLEWGMFTDIGIVDDRTPVVAVVHDCQVVEDKLTPSPTDIIVDTIATPTRLIRVERSYPRPRGIHWDRLEPEVIAATPPLQELQRLRGMSPS